MPPYAVVRPDVIEVLENAYEDGEEKLQQALDRGFSELDRKQPVLGTWLAEGLALSQDELVQSLGYFLVVSVFLAFQEAFPTRLVAVDSAALEVARETLRVDQELREADPHEVLRSDDVLALSQPALLRFVQHHVNEAVEQAPGEIATDELDQSYENVLVQIIAMSHAVLSPSGELGPPREALA